MGGKREGFNPDRRINAAGWHHRSRSRDKQDGPGVTDHEVKIGQTVPYSGPASAFGSYSRVMTGYIQMLNEKGGINGRKLNPISLDNAFSPPNAIEQTRKFLDDDGVLAEVGTVATTPNVAIQKYLNGAKVPHIFISASRRQGITPPLFSSASLEVSISTAIP